jgi:hypothetical protein
MGHGPKTAKSVAPNRRTSVPVVDNKNHNSGILSSMFPNRLFNRRSSVRFRGSRWGSLVLGRVIDQYVATSYAQLRSMSKLKIRDDFVFVVLSREHNFNKL